jgi:hypothetical protein
MGHPAEGNDRKKDKGKSKSSLVVSDPSR